MILKDSAMEEKMITKNNFTDEELAQAICYAWKEDKCISSGWHDFVSTMNQLLRDYLVSPVDDRKVMDDTFKMLTGYDLSATVVSYGGLYKATQEESEFATKVEEIWESDKEENGIDEVARGISYLKETYSDAHSKAIINNVFVATMGHSLSNIEAVLAGAKENAIYDLKEAISDALESGELEDERE